MTGSITSLYFQSDDIDHVTKLQSVVIDFLMDHVTQLQSKVIDPVTHLLSDLHNDCEVSLKLGDVLDHINQY